MRITHGKDSIGELLNELVYLANYSEDKKVSIVKFAIKFLWLQIHYTYVMNAYKN